MAKRTLETEQNSPEQVGKFKDNLNGRDFLGVVEDSADELYMGRCKVRVFGVYDELPLELIPFAYPTSSDVFAGGESSGYGSFSYPKKNTIVRIRFSDGDYYAPEYTVVEGINTKMQAEIKESYENSQVVVYDEDEKLKIIYTKNNGLLIYLNESILHIDKDLHITIEHAGSPSKTTYIDGHIADTANDDIIMKAPFTYLDSTSKVYLGHSPDDHVTKCSALIQLLTQMAAALDAKVPSTPGVNMGLVNANMAKICSQIVWTA